MKQLHIEIQGRVVVLVHTGGAYTPEEWRSVLALARRPDLNELRLIVCDDTPTIDSARRAEVIEAMGGRVSTAAVLTDNVLSRGVITAIGWFKPGMKAFPPDQIEKAAHYLGLTEKERAFASKMLARLRGSPARTTA
jgi:hypothetical protein